LNDGNILSQRILFFNIFLPRETDFRGLIVNRPKSAAGYVKNAKKGGASPSFII
jgi:hypothetical protein